MEGAFTHLGNHLVSDSTSNIRFGDDESVLDGLGGPSRRRRNDDDDQSDVFDDTESMASMSLAGANGKQPQEEEEQVELPPHACSYVSHILYAYTLNTTY